METDFVAKTDSFLEFAKNIAMHIAAVNPVAIKREDVPEALLAREKDIYSKQALDTGKPANIVEKIVAGKIDKFYADSCLLEQQYVKNSDLTVQDLLNEIVATLGENIAIKRFARFQVGA